MREIAVSYAIVTGCGVPSTRLRNIVKRKSVSVGPAHASGWNCTEKIGRVWWMMPSLVPSLALTKNCVQPSGSEFGSTAKPWFLSGHGQQDQAAGRQGASGICAPRPLFSGPGQPRASGWGLGGGGRPHGLRAGEGTLSTPSNRGQRSQMPDLYILLNSKYK